MVSKFVREQKRYTGRDLCRIFECSEEKSLPLIRKLKEFGILKAVRASDAQKDLSDLPIENIEIVDVEAGETELLYVFTFVGVIVVSGCVLKCCPKYLISANEPKEELQQIIKVLERYNSKEQIVRILNDSAEGTSFNLLAVLLFLLHDYYENGTYSNTEEIIESNGTGEILWDRTINDTFTMLLENKPYYMDLRTKKRVNNEYDYFKRLHECVIAKASRELQDAGLLEIFGLTEANLAEEELDGFGEPDYILYCIETELNVQFNTRKQLVLKTIYAYISHMCSLYDANQLSLFGTNSFNLVWEAVCVDICDNQLGTKLGMLSLPIPLKPQYDKNQKLIDLIEKPLWTATGKTASDTLIPDLITIKDDRLIIFDAKYYNAQLEPGCVPKGQPGIESVTKQYLYQLAYKNFIIDHKFVAVLNCFLLPTEGNNVVEKGEVAMQMLSSLGLAEIKVRLLPAKMAYDCYLRGRKLDIDALKLDSPC